MQVERLEQSRSGGRVSNTWVIDPLVRNTGEKSPTIPHTLPSGSKARKGARGRACDRLVSWWGKSLPRPRSVAGLRGRPATLGLRTAQTPTGGSSEEFSVWLTVLSDKL